MKYTIPQILKFTSMTYSSEVSKIGGRTGYLLDNNGNHVTMIPRTSRSSLFFMAGMVFGGLSLAYIISKVSQDNTLHNGLPMIPILFFSLYCFFNWSHDGNEQKEIEESQRTKALKFEPEGIWSLKYPEHLGQQASMIRSLLGARIITRRMTAETSIPMCNETIDARLTHLITEITKCKSNDIHPYLVDETKAFCKQALKDFNFYAPLINLQEEIKDASIKEA